jgi:type I restriction enzyme, S subunit
MRTLMRRSIESLCSRVTSGGTPSRAVDRYWSNGTISWFKTGELRDGWLDDSEEKITEDALKNSAAKVFPTNTVLMAMYGDGKTITSLGILRSPATTNQACCAMIVDPDVCDYRFLFYKLKGERAALLKLVVAGAQRNLSAGIIKGFEVEIPPRDEQARVAHILSAYDDLIENNRRRIALLEEAARLLHREWFVQLRFPGHEHVKVVDGVPDGWNRKSLGEVAECRLGKMLDQNKNKGELMPYLANVNVRWGAIDLDNLREMRFEESELDAVGLKYGDIVMCEGGEPGRCALWKEQVPRMMIQKAIHRIRALPGVSYLYLYYCLRHKGQTRQLASLFTGATIKHLPREKLSAVQVDIPPAPLMMLFAEQVDAIERQISVLEGGTRRASQARDLLLPRLMNGEITV